MRLILLVSLLQFLNIKISAQNQFNSEPYEKAYLFGFYVDTLDHYFRTQKIKKQSFVTKNFKKKLIFWRPEFLSRKNLLEVYYNSDGDPTEYSYSMYSKKPLIRRNEVFYDSKATLKFEYLEDRKISKIRYNADYLGQIAPCSFSCIIEFSYNSFGEVTTVKITKYTTERILTENSKIYFAEDIDFVYTYNNSKTVSQVDMSYHSTAHDQNGFIYGSDSTALLTFNYLHTNDSLEETVKSDNLRLNKTTHKSHFPANYYPFNEKITYPFNLDDYFRSSRGLESIFHIEACSNTDFLKCEIRKDRKTNLILYQEEKYQKNKRTTYCSYEFWLSHHSEP